MSFDNNDTLWDLSLPPSLPSLGDDDFIALLQKQFGVNNDNAARQARKVPDGSNVDPQVLTRFPAQEVSPPLSDDSPSPPSARDMSRSRRESGVYNDSPNAESQSVDDDHALKRKASNEDFDDEPNAKSQHTSGMSKKGNASRRKSGGDESRLAKRKEQNRAAQRAFRERKEKHVKDLEDKVAALEEKNSAAVAENETLRDLIGRLQNENMRLRESSFTFSMPSTSTNQAQNNLNHPGPSRNAITNPFLTGPTSTSPSASSSGSPHSLFEKNEPTALPFFGGQQGLMDSHQSQQTATGDAMSMDFGFGLPMMTTNTPFKTLASNPLYTSYREPMPYATPMEQNYLGGVGGFDFSGQGMGQSMGAWPDVGLSSNVNSHMNLNNSGAFDITGAGSFDELFGGSYAGVPGPIDVAHFKTPSTTSLSPISHHNSGRLGHLGSTPSSSSDSPDSQMSISGGIGSATSPMGFGGSQSHVQSPNNSTGNVNASRNSHGGQEGSSCPKTKEDLARKIAMDTGSMFAGPLTGTTAKPCEKGSNFPKTQKSDANVEVFTAWRTITSNPRYKDIDVNNLCTEFAEKARCDGSKVVLEPQSIQSIMDQCEQKAQQINVPSGAGGQVMGNAMGGTMGSGHSN